MRFALYTILLAVGLASAVSTARQGSTDDVAAVVKFIGAYRDMDFDALKAAATDDFHFKDEAFPLLHNGSMSRAMFHWFINDQSQTQMIVSFDESAVVQDAANGSITVHYTADYYFDSGLAGKNHVVNPITATFTVRDGLVATEEDTYDLGFSGWAEQAFGATLGPLVKDSAATLALVRTAGAAKLGAFMLTHSS
ncbi:hypothetical protein BKA62DRAFT_770333 [Auriculariales sp. MPI-PUGE-AT-0066]|nr:hypothetical protein BKA62DRAFT_770333 [Auriculariales sp. MPI-PUGE-AT-0066]